jgi:hypothetical protein
LTILNKLQRYPNLEVREFITQELVKNLPVSKYKISDDHEIRFGIYENEAYIYDKTTPGG